MWCQSSNSSKRLRLKTLSLQQRSKSLTIDLRQSFCTGIPHHANSAWDISFKCLNGQQGSLETGSRRPERFSSKHLDQPTSTARASHYFRPGRKQSRLSLPPRGQNLLGYSPAYHSEHHPFDAPQHGRANRSNRGALAPGFFTVGIPNTVSRMPESANGRTLEIAALAPPTTLCSPTTTFGTRGSSGTMPENAPHRATTNSGTSAIKETLTSRNIPVNGETTANRSPPADVNGVECLHHNLRPPLRYGSELQTARSSVHCVRPVHLPT